MVPVRYITESEAKLLMLNVIKEYEDTIGANRHKENTQNFKELFAALNNTRGAVWAVGGLLTFVFTVFKIFEAMKH